MSLGSSRIAFQAHIKHLHRSEKNKKKTRKKKESSALTNCKFNYMIKKQSQILFVYWYSDILRYINNSLYHNIGGPYPLPPHTPYPYCLFVAACGLGKNTFVGEIHPVVISLLTYACAILLCGHR